MNTLLRPTAAGFMTLLVAVCVFAGDPTGEPTYKHPVIKDHGGIVSLPDAKHQPQKNAKVVIDITIDDKSGSILKALDRAALILNQYTDAGVGTDAGFKMTIILHGPATKAALTHEAYAQHTSSYMQDKGATKNPDAQLIKQLKNAGVEITVCGQAMAHHGFATNETLSDVDVVVSAATANIALQMNGHAYIPFK